MRNQPRPIVNVFPAEQDEVFLQYGLDVFVAERLADGAAVLVIHHAPRLIVHLPAALPGKISEVGVFQIKRLEQRVEAAKLKELVPVESARTAAAVEAGIQAVDRRIVAMAHAKA